MSGWSITTTSAVTVRVHDAAARASEAPWHNSAATAQEDAIAPLFVNLIVATFNRLTDQPD
jgi:hypothetical protein